MKISKQSEEQTQLTATDFPKNASGRRAMVETVIRIALYHERQGNRVRDEQGFVVLPGVQVALKKHSVEPMTLEQLAALAPRRFDCDFKEQTGDRFSANVFQVFERACTDVSSFGHCLRSLADAARPEDKQIQGRRVLPC